MLFKTVDKLKRQSIMFSIILMAIGVVMIICPEPYIQAMTNLLGYAMIVFAGVNTLEFMTSNKAFIWYIYLTIDIIIGLAGMCVLFFHNNITIVLGWLFGIFLILDGIYSIFNANTYAKRSGRKGWQILILLSLVQMVAGVILILNPFWETTTSLFLTIGIILLCTALIGIVRLIWLWPARTE